MAKEPPKDFQPVDVQAYDLHRLRLGVPEGGRDLIPEKSILLESGLDELNAINWKKGCYIGQELTTRTKFLSLSVSAYFLLRLKDQPPILGLKFS